MLVIVGFCICAVTTWVAFKMLEWEKEDQNVVKEIKEDNEVQ